MALVDWLFPKQCIGCGEIGAYICAICVNYLVPVKNQICPECCKPSGWGRTHPKCQNQRGMAGLTGVIEYRGLGKKLVKTYKYKYVKSLTEDLVEIMISLGDWEGIANDKWLVAAVPLHKKRENWRGFNQADKLAEGIAKANGWEKVRGVLVRKCYTKPQMSLSRKERGSNLAGAFGPGENINNIEQRQVLLVDDVWTTGTTMRECAKVLRNWGVKRVWGLTLARAV
jgi:competence protein ComFC